MTLGQWSIRHKGQVVFTFPHAVPESLGMKFVKMLDKEFGHKPKTAEEFLRIEFWLAHQWDLHCIEEEEKYEEELRKHKLIKPKDMKFFITDPRTGLQKEIKPASFEVEEYKPIKGIDAKNIFVNDDKWRNMDNVDDMIDYLFSKDMPHHSDEEEEEDEEDDND